jgi:L-fuconolactonase
MIIDAHHHLWRRSRGDYDWLTKDLQPLWRDFEPHDLAPLMAEAGVAGGIVVQAAPTEAETQHLLDLAETSPAILGVVGWTNFASSRAPEAIERMAANPRLKGFRPMLQDDPDDDFILRPDAMEALGAMVERGLSFDVLIRPRHLRRIMVLREELPGLSMVIDHAAKPEIAAGAWEPWARELRALAGDGATCCKLSGLVTEAASGASLDDLRRYVDHILAAFGPSRVMWGSDWPVVRLAGMDYADWLAMAQALTAGWPAEARAQIFAGAAARFYRLDLSGVATGAPDDDGAPAGR